MFPLFDENEPGQGIAWVTLSLIGINIAVFLLLQQAGGDNQFTYGFSTIPAEITTGRDIVTSVPVTIGGVPYLIPEAPGPNPIYLTLLTSMFMHGGWLHLGGNMLFLFIFGDNVEHTFGRVFYLLFYLGAGVIASLAQVWAAPDSIIPSLGASGAISGVLGAYLVLFPTNRVRVLVWFFILSVPALVVIGLWAALQFFNGFASIAQTQQTGGVAYLAHVGGFVTGVLVGLAVREFLSALASDSPTPGRPEMPKGPSRPLRWFAGSRRAGGRLLLFRRRLLGRRRLLCGGLLLQVVVAHAIPPNREIGAPTAVAGHRGGFYPGGVDRHGSFRAGASRVASVSASARPGSPATLRASHPRSRPRRRGARRQSRRRARPRRRRHRTRGRRQ